MYEARLDRSISNEVLSTKFDFVHIYILKIFNFTESKKAYVEANFAQRTN